MDRWVGKTAVVTGASSGIGEAISRAFAVAGLHVVGLARREDRLTKLSHELSSSKGSFDGVRCDVRNEDDILNAFKFIEEKFGGVDILVNNSGMIHRMQPSECSAEDIRSILDVNLIGAALCTREAVESMRKRGREGHIVNMNSIVGLNANLAEAVVGFYAVSKVGLRAMSRNYRKEFIERKDMIRITDIYPGYVDTEILVSGAINTLPHMKTKDIADCVIFAVSVPSNVQVAELEVQVLHSTLTP